MFVVSLLLITIFVLLFFAKKIESPHFQLFKLMKLYFYMINDPSLFKGVYCGHCDNKNQQYVIVKQNTFYRLLVVMGTLLICSFVFMVSFS